MEWLSQNWIWIVVAVGAVWLFSRMRHGGAMMGGHGHDTAAQDKGTKPAAHRHGGGCC